MLTTGSTCHIRAPAVVIHSSTSTGFRSYFRVIMFVFEMCTFTSPMQWIYFFVVSLYFQAVVVKGEAKGNQGKLLD